MIPIRNYISKILFQDSSSSFTVITYIDLDELAEDEIKKYMNDVLDKNEILQNRIIKKNVDCYFEKVKHIDLEKQYKIKHLKRSEFTSVESGILNSEFITELQWEFLWCIDSESKSIRMYFKIHHGYADGYQIIRILTSPFKDEGIEKKFKRKTDLFQMFYYMIFGFLSLVIIYFKFLWNVVNLEKEESVQKKEEIDILLFEEIKLDRVKTIAKEKNITVNDFLYSLMLLTDKYYTKEQKKIYISSPINISINKDTNNITPIFNVIQMPETKEELVEQVHESFNALKYSSFIPCLHFLIQYITQVLSISIIANMYTKILDSSNYVFSNIIGPEIKESSLRIRNIGFLTTPKSNEIVYNIISYQNNITLNITFKKDRIQDKKRYLQSLHKAYNDLLE